VVWWVDAIPSLRTVVYVDSAVISTASWVTAVSWSRSWSVIAATRSPMLNSGVVAPSKRTAGP